MSPLLVLYRMATALGEPLAGPYLRRRLRQGKEERARLGERRGHAGLPRPEGALVWLHGASVGEALALLPLIDLLVQRGTAVLLTTGTLTSARVVEGRLPAGASHQLVPLDTPRAVRRFLAHWRPNLGILAESELWPNLMLAARRQGVPLALVNARMSPRSFARWRRLPRTIGEVLGTLDLCLAQSADDASRLLSLGASNIVVAGNMKFDAAPAPVDTASLTQLRDAIGPRPVWLAASTHVDEDEAILDVHARVQSQHPGLLTLVVPRHPEHADRFVAAATARGLNVARRSAGAPLRDDTALYLADTMGELDLFYSLSRLVFVGKSLCGEGGGQNPLEPARLGCAIFHGPLVGNFVDIYQALDASQGACEVDDAQALADRLDAGLADRAATETMGRRAASVAEAGVGATDRTMAALEPLLARGGIAPSS